jgi:hypothetical protein
MFSIFYPPPTPRLMIRFISPEFSHTPWSTQESEADRSSNLIKTIPNQTITNNGVTFTISSGKITLSGTSSATYGTLNFDGFVNAPSGKKVTLSIKLTNPNSMNFAIRLRDTSDGTSYIELIPPSTTISGTSTGGTRLQIATDPSTDYTGVVIESIMLNEGDHPLPYQPYEGPTIHSGNNQNWSGSQNFIGGLQKNGKDVPNVDDLANVVDASHLTKILYADLVALVNAKNLVPGVQYRITDYKPTNSGTDSTGHDFKMAGHQFDIIVTADDSATLNENARAALHDGDTYFASSNLAEWKLKYSIENDVTKFDWADANGHGVIYDMIDEHNNECQYDFKNVMFKRYDVSEFTLVHGQYYNDYSQQKETWFNSVKSTLPFKFYEGFGAMATGQDAVDAGYPDLLDADEQTILESGLTYVIIDDPAWDGDPGLIGTFDASKAKYVWFYTFSIYANEIVSDMTLAKGCHDNRISTEGLSHNVVISSSDSDNCYYNTFGNC